MNGPTVDPLVLVVDDEAQIIRFLKPSLTAAGYRVETAATGTEALKLAATSAPSIIVLDLGLPDMDGKDVIRKLRKWSDVPILVLSARDREAEKIAALDLGADDYVNKPFGIGELMARMRTSLRHHARARDEAATATGNLSVHGLELNIREHCVLRSGELVKLTPKEFDLLHLLLRNSGRVLTHRQILTAVWGPAHTEDTQYLRVFIGQLRQKLEPDPGDPKLIQTEPGIGYRFAPEAD
jgi:two-component system, OmpR family, KDP operon response regulator KdpE